LPVVDYLAAVDHFSLKSLEIDMKFVQDFEVVVLLDDEEE
jgi:hypothetical protein